MFRKISKSDIVFELNICFSYLYDSYSINKTMTYELIKIIDYGSKGKSQVAIDLIELVLRNKYDIEYKIKTDLETTKCDNIHNKKNDTCSVPIKDVFIVLDEEGTRLNIGNTCIGRLINKSLISNIDKADFKKINKIIKTNLFCVVCKKNQRIGYHKKCIKEHYDFIAVKKQLISEHLLHQVDNVFPNITFVANINNSGNISSKQMTALRDLIEEYQYIIDNQNILRQYKNNPIINSVYKQTRKPSIKQTLILNKLIYEYDRMIGYDRCNNDRNYLKYGYVFQKRKSW